MKTNDKAIWNEIYEKENFTPGWVSPGTDPNLVRIIREHLEKTGPAGTVRLLDVGCGNGRNSLVAEALEGFEIRYTGLDFAEKAVGYCRETYGGDKTFLTADMTAPEPPVTETYGVIMDNGCFHSIPPEKRRDYTANLSRLAAPGGLVVIAAWYRPGDRPATDEPSYFPYLYLDEWLLNREDMESFFGGEFELLEEQVDREIYEGLNEGYAYFTLRRKG